VTWRGSPAFIFSETRDQSNLNVLLEVLCVQDFTYTPEMAKAAEFDEKSAQSLAIQLGVILILARLFPP
jgi:hypothetical protein